MFGRCVVLEVEARDDEEDKVHEEADHLHLFTAVKFVINKKCWWTIKVSKG